MLHRKIRLVFLGALLACNPPGDVDSSTPDTGDTSIEADADADADADSDADADADSDADTDEAVDLDGDGFTDDEDCDDSNPNVHPDATETCDGLDTDCDGTVDNPVDPPTWYADTDGDGHGDADDVRSSCEQPTGYVSDDTDCDDADAAVNPDAQEVCDGVDNDCSGTVDGSDATDAQTWYADDDGDGEGDASSATTGCAQPPDTVGNGTDCDDGDDTVNTAADEICDDIDNDCDGNTDDADDDVTDAQTWYADGDGDNYGVDSNTQESCIQPTGYAPSGGDCDDTSTAYNPGIIENDCTDPTDYNCDGSVGFADADSDGFAACEECDDTDAAVNPDAEEICDTIDNDCNGLVDIDDPGVTDARTLYADTDGDIRGDPDNSIQACNWTPGYRVNRRDCDDTDPEVHHDHDELCDGKDNDCDGLVDDADPDIVGATTWYSDLDGDGEGDPGTGVVACSQPAGTVSDSSDCDDSDGAVNTGGTEVCDSIDNDCDGTVDEPSSTDASTWYEDGDSDGFGNGGSTRQACTQPPGYTSDDTDCDDADGAVNTDATEVCDTIDNDCNGDIDDADGGVTGQPTWYADTDGDGFGDSSDTDVACAQPSAYVGDDTDCDDGDGAINPGATEVCDPSDTDEDCDGTADDADSSVQGQQTWYDDDDGDGEGDASTATTSCDPPGSGWGTDSSDCDDGDASVNSAADEECDGIDNNCDGTIDEDAAIDVATWYADVDDDGFGDASSTDIDCNQPTGYVADDTDCDDTDDAVNTDAAEICDTIDNDCDGAIDDADGDVTDQSDWYLDSDGDGHGDPDSSVFQCFSPPNHVSSDTDCDDTDGAVNPDATEVCDAADVDEDCSGAADDADSGVDVSTYTTCFPDVDGDSYGDASDSGRSACDCAANEVQENSDCDDAEALANPGLSEICNDKIDNDCDGGRNSCFISGTDTLAAADTALRGDGAGHQLGWAADTLGDHDGDGTDDLLIGAIGEGTGGNAAGAAYLVQGSVLAGDFAIGSQSTAMLFGESAGDNAGRSVAASDVNGGGKDALVGAPGHDAGGADRGAVYVVHADLGIGAVPLASADSKISGETDLSALGTSVAGGDVTADGVGDVIAGAPNWASAFNEGSAYLFSGATLPPAATADAADTVFRGTQASAQAGYAVANLGDVDGDGIDDVGIAAPYANVEAGRVYVYWGGSVPGGMIDLDASADAIWEGENPLDQAGFSLAGATDVDGDGTDDLLVGAQGYDVGAASNNGAAYLVLGGFGAGTSSLSDARARFEGTGNKDFAGYSVAGPGDIDCDMHADILVGAYNESGSLRGAAYMIYGTSSVAGAIDLGTADAIFTGEGPTDFAGRSVSRTGDTNGDGYMDFMVGADGQDGGGSESGAAYLVLGVGL